MILVVCARCQEKKSYGPVIGYTSYFSHDTKKMEEFEMRFKVDGVDLCPECVKVLIKDMVWK